MEHRGLAVSELYCNTTGFISFRLFSENFYIKINCPVTGLEWLRVFQEVKVPTLHENDTGWW